MQCGWQQSLNSFVTRKAALGESARKYGVWEEILCSETMTLTCTLETRLGLNFVDISYLDTSAPFHFGQLSTQLLLGRNCAGKLAHKAQVQVMVQQPPRGLKCDAMTTSNPGANVHRLPRRSWR